MARHLTSAKGRTYRPFSMGALGGTFAHHSFELVNGVGLVFQPELGLGGAMGMWAAHFGGWAWLASRRGRLVEPALAVLAGASLSGVLTHFVLWPWKLGRGGLPALTSAEGMTPAQMPAYNAILWTWAASGLGSLAFEVHGRSRRWALVGGLTLPLFILSARRHFAWVTEQSATNPAWWNRALQG